VAEGIHTVVVTNKDLGVRREIKVVVKAGRDAVVKMRLGK
jgi:hypothetical protein